MRTLKALGIAAVVGLLSGTAAPAYAQATGGTPPTTMAVPNSSTVVKCNPNGTGTATNATNAETGTANNVPGTPVTQVNPSGQGTTTTQTPMLEKPVKPTVQCAKTQHNAMPATSQNRMMKSAPMMNALTGNPNGAGWLAKYNRPIVAATHKSKRMHRAKHATGGGGY
jgi:hypothetical protein